MKFAMLYSCGKDSALALHRMISEGHTPVCLIVTFNKDAGRSWFHGINNELLHEVSSSLGIPIVRCICTGDTYESEVERCLAQARDAGAEAGVFGDIDIEDHRKWNQDRCDAAGITCMLPLWQQQRESLVSETINEGFKAAIKCIDLSCLDASFLGETLDAALMDRIRATGADVCGENGEYHTFVFDGPIFKTPIPIRLGKKITFNTHAAIDIMLKSASESKK